MFAVMLALSLPPQYPTPPAPSPVVTRQEWYDVPGVGRRLITIVESPGRVEVAKPAGIPAAEPAPAPVVATLYTAPAWCAPCRAFTATWERLKAKFPGVTFREVNCDAGVPAGSGVTRVPSVVIGGRVYGSGEVEGVLSGITGGK